MAAELRRKWRWVFVSFIYSSPGANAQSLTASQM
jgi:hypothetical protein